MSRERYEIVIAKYGSRRARRGEVFLNETVDPDGEIDMAYYFWVIRNASRTILVDTGFAAGVGIQRGRTVHADPLDLFARLGVAPETAPDIIVSHAHYDHIGNLAAFERSAVTIARAELEFWASPMRRRGDFAALTESSEIDALLAADREGRVIAIDGPFEFAPGVRLIPVGGHTPGQLMVEVETYQGTVLLTSDVIHFDEELERDRPFTFLTDLVAQYAAFDLVRGARDVGTIVISGHDPIALSLGVPMRGLEGLAAVVGGV